MAAKQAIIEFQNVSKIFRGGSVGVKNLNLTINDGDFVCLIGSSGSGKTTTMRMINRMIEPTSGRILFKGEDITKQNPVALRRQIGYVIQSIGLMPHMTIYDNITLVPKLLKWPKSKRDEQAERLIKLVDLPESYLDRYPAELSGGQQQRIGVVRALAADQDLILMDEPFGALDPITRRNLQELVKQLQVKLGKTIVFVTHDIDEALKLATKIVVIDQGEIVQLASPKELLLNPKPGFVQNILGPERLNRAKAELAPVSTIMITPVTISPAATLQEAIDKMQESGMDALSVVDNDNHLKGFIEIKSLLSNYGQASAVMDFIRPARAAVSTKTLIQVAARKLWSENAKFVPVIDSQNHLEGIVTRQTLVDMVYQLVLEDQKEEQEEQEELDGQGGKGGGEDG